MMLDLISRPTAPEIKAFAIKSLAGTWTADEARSMLVPLLDASSEPVRIASMEMVAEVMPDRVAGFLTPKNRQHTFKKIAGRDQNDLHDLYSVRQQDRSR